jgi:peptidoglycan/LPS O-acetylase OafA/YrhL
LVGLDLLRLLAVVLVLGRHIGLPPAAWPTACKIPLWIWDRGGWVGVDLFFVLSGFLVSGLLFTEYKSRGRLGIGRFYMRRGWKIYPPFFVLIAATVVVNQTVGWPIPRRSLAAELLFVQSYVEGLWHHTWSLAVEEHFYLLLPLVLALVLRWNRRSPTPLKPILALAAAVAVLALVGRLLNSHYRSPYTHPTHLFASHLRLDSLFFGVAISYVYHFHTAPFVEWLTPWRRTLFLGGAILLTPAFVVQLETNPIIYTLGLTVFYVGSGMMMVGILLSDLPRRRSIALLAALGAYSYSIYLWHMPVHDWVVPLVERAGGIRGFGARSVTYLVGSLVLGVVMAKLVEIPALRLRDRWFPPRSRGPIEERVSGSPRESTKARAIRSLLMIATVYAGGSFVLYRARALNDARIWHSDVMVFYGPAFAALVANGLVLWRVFRQKASTPARIGATMGWAVLTTLAATLCWMFVALNVYGS